MTNRVFWLIQFTAFVMIEILALIDPPHSTAERTVQIAGFSVVGVALLACLFLSSHTLKTHINRIFAKTGSRDRVAAIAYAQRHEIS